MTIQSVCVYCGSSNHVDDIYKQTAQDTGTALAQHGFHIVYGGGKVGLMGILADSALKAGGKVTGIIPRHILTHEIQHKNLTELHIVENMHERKSLMAEKADAFVVLPGGFGTLDEAFEILTWKQLGLHNKPLIVYNVKDFWWPLLALIDRLILDHFAPENSRNIYQTVSTIGGLLEALAVPVGKGIAPDSKWA